MNPHRRQLLFAVAAAGMAGAGSLLVAGASSKKARRARMLLRFVPSIPKSIGYEPALVDTSRFLAESAPFDTSYIPTSRRHPNRDGSCVHLSTRNLFLSHGLYDEAEAWTRAYRGGEYSSRHSERLDKMGIRFAVETRGDDRFLDWACGNLGGAHRGAGITLLGAHVLNLLDIDPSQTPNAKAKWLNNWVGNYDDSQATVWSRERLISDWRRRGGWAFTIISTGDGRGSPPPPLPWIDPNSPY